MSRVRLLSIAVRSGKIGHVFFSGKKLMDWGLSRCAARSPEQTASHTQKLINRLEPEVLVSEKIGSNNRKSAKTTRNIQAVANVADHNYLLDVQVPRQQAEPNKITEAKELAERFPEIKPWVPRPRKLWETEARYLSIFEALTLALQVLDRAEET